MRSIIGFILLFSSVSVICDSAEIPCGVRNTNGSNYERFVMGLRLGSVFQPRVIGGRNAYAGEVPWVTELIMRYPIGGGAMCGGAILDKNTVLTAAHCIFGCEDELTEEESGKVCPSLKAQKIRVCIGERNTADANDGQQCYYSTKYIVHQDYKCCSTNFFNDIAIIKIDEQMEVPKFTKDGLGSTNSICLPKEDVRPGEAFIAGWGRDNPKNYHIPKILQTANVSMISLEECEETYGEYVAQNQTCARGKRGESACNGDSGSAVFTEDESEISSAVGVSSFVATRRCTGHPVVYANVYSYLDFIRKNMG